MALSPDESPDEDYFNDLSRQPTKLTNDTDRQPATQEDNSQIPKPKRIACVLCRKRKLKCDGVKPSCGTCNRLQHDCSYDEVRRKSGPKRGYVKALEARLAQVETLLKGQDEPSGENEASKGADKSNGMATGAQQHNGSVPELGGNITAGSNGSSAQAAFPQAALNLTSNGDVNMPQEDDFPWEMIGLGLEEPLPPQDAIDELTQAFFDKIHPSGPMIHRARFYAAMHLAPHARPPICLRYAMWANAAAVTEKYDGLQEHFYQRARKYIQQDEMRGHGEGMITIAHAQTWVLLATYEFKMMFFPRAWMSAGRACRMTQMMGLHRLDGTGLEVKQCLPPPRDWTEREERRRTFWMSFCVDRYSSIGTGWPMVIEERDILTNLPVDEKSFEMSKPQKGISLGDALEPTGAQKISSFGAVVLLASLFGRNLTHLHRPGPNDNDDDINGEFWKRHSQMDSILLHTALALPDSLRLPHGLNDPNIIFMNMNIHTSAICLHQAAIFKADKNRMPARISAESKVRCITAAAEIASIMRTISHLDLASMNPFISFCLYVAARVFVQYLKSRPKDNQIRTSLQFLLSAMHAIKRKNPLTESFLVQLDVDLEGAGLEDTRALRQQMPKQSTTANRSPGCPSGHLGMSEVNATPQRPPAYGDQGLAVYNQPDSQNVPSIPVHSGISDPYNQELSDSSFANFTPHDGIQFDVTNREQRTPGSLHTLNDSNTFRSPANLNPDMDTSPDGSGAGGQHTPSSQQNSSHTSNTAYSPQTQQDAIQQQHQNHPPPTSQPAYTTNNQTFFDPNDPAFTTAFDMSSFPATAFEAQSQQSFLQNQTWDSGGGGGGLGTGTGLTPGGPGVDIMTMSDVDWNQMMEGLGDWNQAALLGQEGNVEQMATNGDGRRS
ncbi:hypothetical protein Q7P37_001298 [Cladosporium fusiforme]